MDRNAYYNLDRGPYCLCCGSREVMTLDIFIAETNDSERKSRLKDKRLWFSIKELDEYELDAFVSDTVSGAGVDDVDEFEAELYSHLTLGSHYERDRYWYHRCREALELSEIEECEVGEFLTERKYAFLRLWGSFDDKTKSSFLRRASLVKEKSGACN